MLQHYRVCHVGKPQLARHADKIDFDVQKTCWCVKGLDGDGNVVCDFGSWIPTEQVVRARKRSEREEDQIKDAQSKAVAIYEQAVLHQPSAASEPVTGAIMSSTTRVSNSKR